MQDRIIDANLNRLSEGLRVIEDAVRFGLDDADLSRRLKALRHGVKTLRAALPANLIAGRDSVRDVGREKVKESATRESVQAILDAAFGRVAESLRVIEEFAKLESGNAATQAKAMRYEAYELHRLVLPHFDRTHLASRLRGLYLILTEPLVGYETLAGLAVKAGVAAIQLRDKKLESGALLALARRLREITARSKTLFIVNDRPDIARLCNADGVHVGQGDLSVAETRSIVGERMLIGKSTHNAGELAAALKEKPDYVGIGPLFGTRSKENPSPTLGIPKAQRLLKSCPVPAVAIGGLNEKNVPQVLGAGFAAYALIAHVGGSPRPASALKRLEKIERAIAKH